MTISKEADHAGLSQGEERIEINYSFRSIGTDYKTSEWSGQYTPSWNEIIANVFPVCIDEANEIKILHQFNNYIERPIQI